MSTELVYQLRRQNRLLKAVLVTVCLGMACIALMGAQAPSHKTKFSEIDVERINVLNPDGSRALVLAGRGLLPGPIIDGKEESRSGDQRPGMVFYNQQGDEVGGLIYDGKLGKDGKPEGGVHFSMDRYGGDQQLALHQYDDHGTMETGLSVFDSGLIKDTAPLYEAYQKAVSGPDKDALLKRWKDAGGEQTQRLFLGRTRGQSSALVLADAQGRPRIMMTVTPEGEPSLEFMDEKGEVIQRLPQSNTKG